MCTTPHDGHGHDVACKWACLISTEAPWSGPQVIAAGGKWEGECLKLKQPSNAHAEDFGSAHIRSSHVIGPRVPIRLGAEKYLWGCPSLPPDISELTVRLPRPCASNASTCREPEARCLPVNEELTGLASLLFFFFGKVSFPSLEWQYGRWNVGPTGGSFHYWYLCCGICSASTTLYSETVSVLVYCVP